MVEMVTLWDSRSHYFCVFEASCHLCKPSQSACHWRSSMVPATDSRVNNLSATIGACWWERPRSREVWRETIRRRYVCGCNVQRVALTPGTSWQRTSTQWCHLTQTWGWFVLCELMLKRLLTVIRACMASFGRIIVNVTWKGCGRKRWRLFDAGTWQERLELCAESCSQRSGIWLEVGDIHRGWEGS